MASRSQASQWCSPSPSVVGIELLELIEEDRLEELELELLEDRALEELLDDNEDEELELLEGRELEELLEGKRLEELDELLELEEGLSDELELLLDEKFIDIL